MSIRVVNLTKTFGGARVVDDLSFDLPEGELVALLGPSGGGKSTILRLIAGLEKSDHGEVWLGGQRVDHLHARKRNVGFVFQQYALFQHMTVEKNIAFGLQVQGMRRKERAARVEMLLGILGLDGLGDRKPSQLSGGQRQRVALARALAPSPRLLLLDEPFGAVDAQVREDLRRWLRRLHDEMCVTSIFVTHDQAEAFAIADRIVVIHKGRLEQDGEPSEILDQPATEFVARFVGEVNVFEGHLVDGTAITGSIRAPAHELGDLPAGTPVRVVVRAYDVRMWRDERGPATVRRVLPLGDRVRVEAVLDDGGSIFAHFPRRAPVLHTVEEGARMGVHVTEARAWPIEADGR